MVSRESALLTNNVLLLVACAAVLLGTLYPLFLDALGLGKISVVAVSLKTKLLPLMAPAVFIMCIDPRLRRKHERLPKIGVRLKWAAAVAVVSALLLPLSLGQWTPLLGLGILLAVWILASSAVNLKARVAQLRAASGASLSSTLRQLPRGYWGMLLAHCGVGVFIIGVTLVRGYQAEREVRMNVGESVNVGG